MSITEMICVSLSGMGRDFIAEGRQEGMVGVFMTGECRVIRRYIDGSYTAELPFKLSLRIPRSSHCPEEGIAAAELFDEIAEYARSLSIEGQGGMSEICISPLSPAPYSAYSRTSVHGDGTAEYTAGYVFRAKFRGDS